MPRVLVSDDGVTRVWRITDSKGGTIGADVESVPTPEEGREALLRRQSAAALTGNRAFLALPAPSAAQATAQVKALTRQVSALIRLQVQAFDDVEE